jgi:Tol biopolymer transport system component
VSVSPSGQPTVLFESRDFPIIYNPRLSPDGKWVIFSSMNFPRTNGEGPSFDLLGWLLMQPEVAEAHGLPWDIYIMPTTGGAPSRLTHLNEDQPVATWIDNTTVALIGTSGLYKVQITSDGQAGQKPDRIYDGVSHSGLAWHAP